MKFRQKFENNIWAIYAIIIGSGILSEELDAKTVLLLLLLVGVIHLRIAIKNR